MPKLLLQKPFEDEFLSEFWRLEKSEGLKIWCRLLVLQEFRPVKLQININFRFFKLQFYPWSRCQRISSRILIGIPLKKHMTLSNNAWIFATLHCVKFTCLMSSLNILAFCSISVRFRGLIINSFDQAEH